MLDKNSKPAPKNGTADASEGANPKQRSRPPPRAASRRRRSFSKKAEPPLREVTDSDGKVYRLGDVYTTPDKSGLERHKCSIIELCAAVDSKPARARVHFVGWNKRYDKWKLLPELEEISNGNGAMKTTAPSEVGCSSSRRSASPSPTRKSSRSPKRPPAKKPRLASPTKSRPSRKQASHDGNTASQNSSRSSARPLVGAGRSVCSPAGAGSSQLPLAGSKQVATPEADELESTLTGEGHTGPGGGSKGEEPMDLLQPKKLRSGDRCVALGAGGRVAKSTPRSRSRLANREARENHPEQSNGIGQTSPLAEENAAAVSSEDTAPIRSNRKAHAQSRAKAAAKSAVARSRRKSSVQSTAESAAVVDSTPKSPMANGGSSRTTKKRPRDPSRRRSNPSRKCLPSAKELNRIIEQQQHSLSSSPITTETSQRKKLVPKKEARTSNDNSITPLFPKPSSATKLSSRSKNSETKNSAKLRVKSSQDMNVKEQSSSSPTPAVPQSTSSYNTRKKSRKVEKSSALSENSQVRVAVAKHTVVRSRGGGGRAARDRSSSPTSDAVLSALVPRRPTRGGLVRSSSLPGKKRAPKVKLPGGSPQPSVKSGRRTRKRTFGVIRSDQDTEVLEGDRPHGGSKKKQRTSAVANGTRSHNSKAADSGMKAGNRSSNSKKAASTLTHANGASSSSSATAPNGAKKRTTKRSKPGVFNAQTAPASSSSSAAAASSRRDDGPTLRTRRSTRFAKQVAQARIFDPRRSAVTLSGHTMRQEQNRRASKLSRTWSVGEVEEWAKRLDAESSYRIAQRFAAAKISGEMLCQMTAHDLRARFEIDDTRALDLILDEIVCAHLQDFGESLTRRHGAPQRESDYHRAPPRGSNSSSKPAPSSSTSSSPSPSSSSSTSSKPSKPPSDASDTSRQPETVPMEDGGTNATTPSPTTDDSYPYWVVPPFERSHVNPSPHSKTVPRRFRNRPRPRRRKGQTEDIVRTF